MKITASIVIYNETEENLKSLISKFLKLNFEKELIIVDNSPTDILRDFISSFNIKYIKSNNIGFGAGHNLAFKNFSIKSDLHLILNPDIYFDVEQLQDFIIWFNSQEDIVLAIPRVFNIDNTIQEVVRNKPTILGYLKRKFTKDSDILTIKDYSIQEIPTAHGCFFIFKRDTFEQLNGFDERFFMYMEDLDIWLRAKRYGKTVINTNFYIYHQWRKESSQSIKLLFIHLISLVKFFLKKR